MSFPIRRTRRPSSLSLSVSPDAHTTTSSNENASDPSASNKSPQALLREALFAQGHQSGTSPTRAGQGQAKGGSLGPGQGGRRRSLLGVEDPFEGDESALSMDVEDEAGSPTFESRAQPLQEAKASETGQIQSGLQDLLATHLKEYKLASAAPHATSSPINSNRSDETDLAQAQSDQGKRIWGMPEWKEAIKSEEVRLEYGYGNEGRVGRGGNVGGRADFNEGPEGGGTVKVISIEDLALLLNHYHKLDTPSEVLFPWMHGLGDGPHGPAGGVLEEFFGYPSLDAPRYRGLTILKAKNTPQKQKRQPPAPEPRNRRGSLPGGQTATSNADSEPSMPARSSEEEQQSSKEEDHDGRTRADSVSTYASSESTLPSLSSFGQASDQGDYADGGIQEGYRGGSQIWRITSPASSMSSVAIDSSANDTHGKEGIVVQDPNLIQGMHPTCEKTTSSSSSCPTRGLAATVSRLLGKAFDGNQERKDPNQDGESEQPEEPQTPTEHRIRFDIEDKAGPSQATRRPVLEMLRRASAPDAAMHASVDMSRTASGSSNAATPEIPTSASPSERTSILRTSSAMGRARSPSPMPGQSPLTFPHPSPGHSSLSSTLITSPATPAVEVSPAHPSKASDGRSDTQEIEDLVEDAPLASEKLRCMMANALRAEDVLDPGWPGKFKRPDMSGEISLRNLSIQEIKYSTLSDLIIYSEHGIDESALETSRRAIQAQIAIQRERRELFAWERQDMNDCETMPDMSQMVGGDITGGAAAWQAQHVGHCYEPVCYTVFVLKESFEVVRARFPSLVCDETHLGAPSMRDLFQREVTESNKLARASEISGGIWLGNSNDNPYKNGVFRNPSGYNIIVECHDTADMPSEKLLNDLKDHLRQSEETVKLEAHQNQQQFSSADPIFLECCSSSRSVGSGHYPLDVLTSRVAMLAGVIGKAVKMARRGHKGRLGEEPKVLIFCEDGYTETAIIALTYLMLVKGISLEDAYLSLQLECNRSFFVYPFDMAFLDQIERYILNQSTQVQVSGSRPSSGSKWRPFTSGQSSRHEGKHRKSQAASPQRTWTTNPRFDGSLPSRILPHLYLGNLGHAANSRLLHALGITHVISVGESLGREFGVSIEHYVNAGHTRKRSGAVEGEGRIVVLEIEDVKDDGNDSLRPKIARACEFIRDAEAHGGRTLVHCRVGVSRSATIVLAYLVKYHGMSLMDAYMLTRCRRLNVLIQPHLRFLHELLGWEVEAGKEGDHTSLATRYSWPALCRDLWELNHRFLVKSQ